MVPITVGRVYNAGKVAKITCVPNDRQKEPDIQDACFMLVVLTAGQLCFSRGDRHITANAPCFVCFNEQENPILTRRNKAVYHTIYFHPDFLNKNMSFDFIRSRRYGDMAEIHDMFMLKPFLDNAFIVPMVDSLVDRMDAACRHLQEELATQRDWYWSCRGRSYFMEIVIALERMYGLMGYGEPRHMDVSFSLANPKLRQAVLFIEGHYMEEITLEDVSRAGCVNHTTLNRLMRQETGMTVGQYLYFYRVQVAKKQLEFTGVPVKDIAAATGFKTVQHFSRVFTRLMGNTPANFRKEAVEKRIRDMKDKP